MRYFDWVVLTIAFLISAASLDDFPHAPGNAAILAFPLTYALLRRRGGKPSAD